MAKLEIIGGILLFNLDADVGKLSPNRIDDVELVRFGYIGKKNSPNVVGRLTPRETAALQALRPRGGYDSDIQEVINAHQESRGGTQDGKVSVGKSQLAHGPRYDNKHAWIIYNLCHNMADAFPYIYPRIDLHELSGPDISKRVRQLLDVAY